MSDSAAGPLAAVSVSELLFPDFALEHAATRRVLERVPEGHADWRPHAKSRTLAVLATHVAGIPALGTSILTTDERDMASAPPVQPRATAAELVALHDANVEQLKQALAGADLEHLQGIWTLRRGDQVIVSGPRHVLLRRMTFSHAIHHRAQLGTYLRQLDVPVPAIYGPSADEQPASA